MDFSKLDSLCLNGVYKEFVELIGYKNTLPVYNHFAGQYVTFPKNFLSEQYLYSWVMKILKRKYCNKYCTFFKKVG